VAEVKKAMRSVGAAYTTLATLLDADYKGIEADLNVPAAAPGNGGDRVLARAFDLLPVSSGRGSPDNFEGFGSFDPFALIYVDDENE